jgi:hypothetical protein
LTKKRCSSSIRPTEGLTSLSFDDKSLISRREPA